MNINLDNRPKMFLGYSNSLQEMILEHVIKNPSQFFPVKGGKSKHALNLIADKLINPILQNLTDKNTPFYKKLLHLFQQRVALMIRTKIPNIEHHELLKHQAAFIGSKDPRAITAKQKLMCETASKFLNLQIKNISPSENQHFTPEVTQLVVYLWKSHLQSLCFPKNNDFKAIVFNAIPYEILKHLTIPSPVNLSKEQLLVLISCLPSTLESFSISDSVAMDNDVIELLSQRCPNLINLALQRCPNITALPKLNSLKILDLSGSQISDDDLVAIATNIPGIEELDLSCCNLISRFPHTKQLKNT